MGLGRGGALRDHEHDPVADRPARGDRPLGHRAAVKGKELLQLTEAGAGPAGHDDPPHAAHARVYGRASFRRCSAVSSSTARAKVSSDTRIWRARDSMRFSPAERPLSLSRIERFRTTSATW